MNHLIHYLEQIEDPRHKRGIRHRQIAILIIMILAILCGYTGLRAQARFAKAHQKMLGEFLPLPRGKVPSYWTLRELIKSIDFNQVCQAFNDWMAQYFFQEGIAIDGKSIKSTVTSSQNSHQSFGSTVSFFGQQTHLVRQVGILENHKTSEIQVVQQLFENFQIKKVVLTLDALHCQKKTVEMIIQKQNGYLIPVKKNQPTLRRSIEQAAQDSPLNAWSWTQKGHGHQTHCRLKIWEAPYPMKEQWAGLKRFISVRRYGIRHKKYFDSITYYITSEILSAYAKAGFVRGHRRIENNLHWTKDVILNEDNCGILEPHSAAILGIFRNIAFNLLQMNGFKSITEGICAMSSNVKRLWKIITHSQPKMGYILDG
jgi:predicted transposase YbfD/YdcC